MTLDQWLCDLVAVVPTYSLSEPTVVLALYLAFIYRPWVLW